MSTNRSNSGTTSVAVEMDPQQLPKKLVLSEKVFSKNDNRDNTHHNKNNIVVIMVAIVNSLGEPEKRKLAKLCEQLEAFGINAIKNKNKPKDHYLARIGNSEQWIAIQGFNAPTGQNGFAIMAAYQPEKLVKNAPNLRAILATEQRQATE